MTPDINTAQITLVAQTEFDSGVQWLYVPCVCVCSIAYFVYDLC